jgi:hypothetical protein
MRVSLEEFREEIAEQIRRLAGQEEDPGFVSTLRNYVLGLVKHHGTADPAAMQKKLREFLEGNTTEFVRWYATVCLLSSAATVSCSVCCLRPALLAAFYIKPYKLGLDAHPLTSS